jgi:hypothetical protein
MDAQSSYILRSLADATRCATRLVREGYTIISVHLGNRRPRIVIERSARCARLHGAMAVRIHDAGGRKQIYTADLEDCQIQWTEEGAA